MMKGIINENEMIEYVKRFFKREGWRLTSYRFSDFTVDIAAVKGDDIYIVEVKAQTKGGPSWLIKYAIGELVAHMQKGGSNVHYGIALPGAVAVFLMKFGLEGLKVLNLHLFYVEDEGSFLWPKGTVWHLSPEKVLEFVRQLKEQVEPSLWSLASPL